MTDGLEQAFAADTAFAVKLSNINKRFGEVWANRDINLAIPKGTIHGIIGENGAGKSTLMSILFGFYEADSGQIVINDRPVKIKNSDQAIALGIGMVHQHFMLVETLTVLENVVLGAEKSWSLRQSLAPARKKLEAITEQYGLTVPLDSLVGDLPVGLQQRVEILKSLYRDADVLILDEPTGVLTPQEADQLFDILDNLRQQGKTIVLITHKLREIMHITDNVSVMRRGTMVAHRQTANTTAAELAELMVGRPVLLDVDKTPAKPQQTRLAVKGLGLKDKRGVQLLQDIHFELRAGEILGIAGVSGNGQSQLLEVLAGMKKATSGEVHLHTDKVDRNYAAKSLPDPRQMRELGLRHVPEDRLGEGLIKTFSMQESAILGYSWDEALGKGMILSPKKVTARTEQLIENFDVRPPNPKLKSANMSGGNQQKLIIAREMNELPQIFLVGQPTRGVDIGAIENIYKALIEARDRGAAILLVSVELDEIMALSDRIMVMNQGRIVGIVNASETNANELGLMMAGEQQLNHNTVGESV
ncbi:MAG: heme ABC transporter ATP-binding protein [Gammaproteobacteria bacterium]|nr:MAG: heme ABC transporter ATP-binding protein [Gammaproteobacteria bacterium]